MSTSQEEYGELLQRVRRLERQNRRWKVGGIAAIAVLAASLTATAWAQQRNAMPFRTPTVEAEHFVLKDADGVTRGQFTMTLSGPVLELLAPDGKVIWSTRPHMLAQPAKDGQ